VPIPGVDGKLLLEETPDSVSPDGEAVAPHADQPTR
jgi:hypothetical protein